MAGGNLVAFLRSACETWNMHEIRGRGVPAAPVQWSEMLLWVSGCHVGIATFRQVTPSSWHPVHRVLLMNEHF